MNLQPDKRGEDSVGIDLTPLIDVVFLLLIFFMVSTTFDKSTRLKVSLPQADSAEQAVIDDAIEITVDAGGRYFVNERELVNAQLDTLKLALKKVAGDNVDSAVVLRADANAPHHSVVTAMDAVSQLGITRLSIATVRKP
jgi:biopolymer transport protein ExbD